MSRSRSPARKELISIITPTYNHEPFVGEALSSVRSQTHMAWEHIIVDDGSEDGTWGIVEAAAESDSRVRPFRQEHRGIEGLSATYNHALDQCRGDRIAILEGDDFWPPDKLAVQATRHRSGEVQVSYGWADALLADGSRSRLAGPPFRGRIGSGQFLRHLLLGQAAVQPVTLMVDRALLETVGQFCQEGMYAVDLPTLLCLAAAPVTVEFIDHPLGVWRQHEAQITRRVFGAPGSFDGNGVSAVAERVEATLRIQLATRAKLSLASPTDKEITQANAAGIAEGYFVALRRLLASGQASTPEVIVLTSRLWRFGGWKRRGQAVYALACCRLHLNFELPFRLYEKIRCRRGAPASGR